MSAAALLYISLMTATGIGLWIKGYRNPVSKPPNDNFEFLSILVQAPTPVFLLCGAPEAPGYPKGVMSTWAFSSQLLGLGILVHILAALWLRQNLVQVFISLSVVYLIVYGSAYWLTKHRKYEI